MPEHFQQTGLDAAPVKTQEKSEVELRQEISETCALAYEAYDALKAEYHGSCWKYDSGNEGFDAQMKQACASTSECLQMLSAALDQVEPARAKIRTLANVYESQKRTYVENEQSPRAASKAAATFVLENHAQLFRDLMTSPGPHLRDKISHGAWQDWNRRQTVPPAQPASYLLDDLVKVSAEELNLALPKNPFQDRLLEVDEGSETRFKPSDLEKIQILLQRATAIREQLVTQHTQLSELLVAEEQRRVAREAQEREQAAIAAAERRRAEIGELLQNSPEQYRDMMELFGDHFLGLEALKKAFTLQNGIELIDFSLEQRQAIEAQLVEFVSEPDVAQFLERLENGSEQKAGWHLRYEPSTITVVDAQTGRRQTVPLTMEAMRQNLAPDMAARQQGKLLYSDNDPTAWYRTQHEAFVYEQAPAGEWVLGTDELVTRGKNYDGETRDLQAFAAQKGLAFDAVKSRRAPYETLLTSATSIRAFNRRILVNDYDRSATISSDGDLVRVGLCDARGAHVHGSHPEATRGPLGSSFSRRSGQSGR